MIKVRMFRKIITTLLIFSLVYANANMAILGVVSYAIDNVQEAEETTAEEKKIIDIEISEFSKNAMLEQETEYSEKITLNMSYETSFKEIIVSDVNAKIYNQISAEGEEAQEANTFYTSTKINKEELINKIGQNGSLEIEYFELQIDSEENEIEEDTEQEQNTQVVVTNQASQEVIKLPEQEENTSEQDVIELPVEEEKESIELPEEEVIVLPEEDLEEEEVITLPEEEPEEEPDEKGIINAENGLIEINKDTETDEEGYITIIYPENTNLVNLKIVTEKNQIQELEIINSKKIEKLENIEEIKLETSKKIYVQDEEKHIETVETPIYYTKTVAELGIDKTEISTSVDNKVNFTITMSTDKMVYDLYKNPQFIIELPSELETINIDNIIILNNQYFEIETIEQGLLENGNKAILLKLKGEQTEYTKSIAENIQILLETTIKTNQLIPTLNKVINLHYYNENAKTYDGIGTQENGINSCELNLVSNSEIIIETKAIFGENTITSLREDYKEVTVEQDAYQTVQIIGTAINNIGEDIQNAIILGTVTTNMGQIAGVEKVYYTENENATTDLNNAENMWSAEYSANAKKYLIVLDNFSQGQTVTFGFNMNLYTDIENDIKHEVSFDVYNNENIKTSKITINQEAKRADIFGDEKIQANIVSQNTEVLSIGQYAKYNINIANISGEDMQNVSITIELPEVIENGYAMISNGDENKILAETNKIEISKLDIQKGETVTIEIIGKIAEYINAKETIKANIYYNERQAEISAKINIAEPVTLETTITSDKIGQTLEANETIEYIITLKNNSQVSTTVDMNISEMDSLYIQKIETINIATGKTFTIASGDLTGNLRMISINPGEVVEIKVQGTTKELKKESTLNMYANITGINAKTISTSQLVNVVNKKVEEQTDIDTNVEATAQVNSIQGIAWLDKNENGRKDENETILKGIQATLVDTENSNVVATKTTNSQGQYSFENVPEGNYIVEFKYNTKTLSITEYKQEEVEIELDSDIVKTTQNNQETAKTEVIALTAGTSENVNAGFVVNNTFDMSINKGITKVTVNNEQGTEEYDFENTNMAKVEIEGEYLKGSLILVEYEIAVTNIGEVAGYAKLVSDKIPEGMKFSSELNSSWYENDGTLYSVALADKELQQGETATIKLVLTKEMTDDKIVSPVNTAQIEETFNEYLIEDKKQDNNSAEATIIISLTTGKAESYIWITLIVITIIGAGSFGVQILTKKSNNTLTNKERRK